MATAAYDPMTDAFSSLSGNGTTQARDDTWAAFQKQLGDFNSKFGPGGGTPFSGSPTAQTGPANKGGDVTPTNPAKSNSGALPQTLPTGYATPEKVGSGENIMGGKPNAVMPEVMVDPSQKKEDFGNKEGLAQEDVSGLRQKTEENTQWLTDLAKYVTDNSNALSKDAKDYITRAFGTPEEMRAKIEGATASVNAQAAHTVQQARVDYDKLNNSISQVGNFLKNTVGQVDQIGKDVLNRLRSNVAQQMETANNSTMASFEQGKRDIAAYAAQNKIPMNDPRIQAMMRQNQAANTKALGDQLTTFSTDYNKLSVDVGKDMAALSTNIRGLVGSNLTSLENTRTNAQDSYNKTAVDMTNLIGSNTQAGVQEQIYAGQTMATLNNWANQFQMSGITLGAQITEDAVNSNQWVSATPFGQAVRDENFRNDQAFWQNLWNGISAVTGVVNAGANLYSAMNPPQANTGSSDALGWANFGLNALKL